MERVDDRSDEQSFMEHKKESHIRLVREIEDAVSWNGYVQDDDNPSDFFLEFIRQEKIRNDVITIW